MRSLRFLIKKYFWQISIFFIVAITSGVLLADHEAKSPSSWETFTSRDAGLSFKYPKFYKVVEDKGWRITVYTSPENTENNIKIVYTHTDHANTNGSADAQFLANCQPEKVNIIDAGGTPLKVYENNTCGGQTIPATVIVNSENGIDYDISLFGKTDMTVLYPFLSTFSFGTATAPLPEVTLQVSIRPSTMPSDNPKEHVACTMDAKQCPNGSWVGRTGPHCMFVCPK